MDPTTNFYEYDYYMKIIDIDESTHRFTNHLDQVFTRDYLPKETCKYWNYWYNNNGQMIRRRHLIDVNNQEEMHGFGEHYEYNMNGLLRRMLKFKNVGQGEIRHCDGFGFMGTPTIWEYKYSPMNEREQKRKIGVGNGLPWVYYLLDGTKKPAVIYNGVETNEPLIAYEGSDNIIYFDDNFLYQGDYEEKGDTVWQYIDYSTTPATEHLPKTTRSIVYMYPVEYLTYGAAGHDLTWKYDGTDWIREVNVKDMLGSVRSVVREGSNQVGRVIAEYDYEPFGKQLPISGKSDRLDYINKETDEESTLGMADYGVRKYDSFTSRFMTADVLFEKYPSWNPYHYAANNPVSFLDNNGREVIAIDEASRQNIINSVEAKYRDNIGFMDNGKVYFTKDLNVGPLRQDLENFSNIRALQFLVNSEEVVEVSENNEFIFTQNNVVFSDNLDNYKANGATLLRKSSDEKDVILSTKENTSQVIISPNQFKGLSGKSTKASTTAHELYGHYFLWLWNKAGYQGPLWKDHEGDTRDHIIDTEKNSK